MSQSKSWPSRLDNKRSTDGPKPWWVEFIYKIGIPSAIALYLIFFLAQKVDRKLDVTIDVLKEHNVMMGKQAMEQLGAAERQKMVTDKQAQELSDIHQLMQQICVSTAEQADRSSRECLK